MKDKSVVGDLINFRGLVYSPTNENGVIFLFGKVVEDLNMYIEEIKPGFPDCVARRFNGKGWERTYIEFEHTSLNFRDHGHNHKDCDIVVCWEHNWPECPLEVIELKEVIATLPNTLIQRPDSETHEYSLKEHLQEVPEQVQKLFQEFDERVKGIADGIYHKPAKNVITYYSPKRVFIYLHLRKKGLTLQIFTRGQPIEGVKSLDYQRGGAKWGVLFLTDIEQLDTVLQVIKRSHKLINETIKKNEPTGWFADIEDREEAEEEDALPGTQQPSDL